MIKFYEYCFYFKAQDKTEKLRRKMRVMISSPDHANRSFQETVAREIYQAHYATQFPDNDLFAWTATEVQYMPIANFGIK